MSMGTCRPRGAEEAWSGMIHMNTEAPANPFIWRNTNEEKLKCDAYLYMDVKH